jgi:hypothetical protein
LLSPLLDELAARGFVAGPEAVGRRFEQLGSRPAMIANGLPDGFADKVESGHKAWVGGDFDRAIQILRPLVDAAHASPGAFAQNQPLRDKLLKALIALALSDLRIGDRSAARNVFGEVLRSFPEAQLSRATYGPEAFDAFGKCGVWPRRKASESSPSRSRIRARSCSSTSASWASARSRRRI